MKNEDYRKIIIEMVNRLEDNAMLRKIYLIITAAIGAGE